MNRQWISALPMVLLAAFAAGCGGAPPAAPPPPAPEPAAPAIRIIEDPHDVRACVVRNGRMEIVDVDYNTATGDTTMNGRPFRDLYPLAAGHAASAEWYASDEPITFAGRRFVKYGLPRLLSPDEVVPAGSYRGVAVFVEAGVDPARPEVVYLAVDPRCEFQPYHGPDTGAVRG